MSRKRTPKRVKYFKVGIPKRDVPALLKLAKPTGETKDGIPVYVWRSA